MTRLEDQIRSHPLAPQALRAIRDFPDSDVLHEIVSDMNSAGYACDISVVADAITRELAPA